MPGHDRCFLHNARARLYRSPQVKTTTPLPLIEVLNSMPTNVKYVDKYQVVDSMALYIGTFLLDMERPITSTEKVWYALGQD